MERGEGQALLDKGTVRLRLPAAVANDLGRLQKSIVELSERMGCRACFSGADCLFEVEKRFVVDDGVRVAPDPSPWRALPQDPVPFRGIQVGVAAEVGNEIGRVQDAIERVLGKLGCQACCSGFDIFFRRELDALHVDRELNVQGFGRFA
jgi:hypothetical protein